MSSFWCREEISPMLMSYQYVSAYHKGMVLINYLGTSGTSPTARRGDRRLFASSYPCVQVRNFPPFPFHPPTEILHTPHSDLYTNLVSSLVLAKDALAEFSSSDFITPAFVKHTLESEHPYLQQPRHVDFFTGRSSAGVLYGLDDMADGFYLAVNALHPAISWVSTASTVPLLPLCD